MMCDDLLRLVARLHGVNAEAQESRTRAISFARRFAASRSRTRTRSNTLPVIAMQAQVQYTNREHAGSADYHLNLAGNRQASKGVGTGKWKQRTEEEVIRIVFSEPYHSVTSVAKSMRPRASERYVTDLVFACSRIILLLQSSAMAAQLATAVYVVFQFVFDEASFRVLLGGANQRRANDRSVLASHGRLLWAAGDLKVEEEEVVMPPSNIERNTASHMWTAFEQMMPLDCWKLINSESFPPTARVIALCPGSDHHSANEMLLAKIANDAASNVIVLEVFCRQHDTGNCLAPVQQKLNILNPCFCIAKRLRSDKFEHRFVAGIRRALDAD